MREGSRRQRRTIAFYSATLCTSFPKKTWDTKDLVKGDGRYVYTRRGHDGRMERTS